LAFPDRGISASGLSTPTRSASKAGTGLPRLLLLMLRIRLFGHSRDATEHAVAWPALEQALRIDLGCVEDAQHQDVRIGLMSTATICLIPSGARYNV
jgi:hypothetical protein